MSGEIAKLDKAKAALDAAETPEEIAAIEAQARVVLLWATEQKKLLAGATTNEAQAVLAEAERVARLAGELLIRAKAKIGAGLPPKSKGGRGNKLSDSNLTVSRDTVHRLRRLAELVPLHLDAYIAHCEQTGEDPFRTKFLSWAEQREVEAGRKLPPAKDTRPPEPPDPPPTPKPATSPTPAPAPLAPVDPYEPPPEPRGLALYVADEPPAYVEGFRAWAAELMSRLAKHQDDPVALSVELDVEAINDKLTSARWAGARETL